MSAPVESSNRRKLLRANYRQFSPMRDSLCIALDNDDHAHSLAQMSLKRGNAVHQLEDLLEHVGFGRLSLKVRHGGQALVFEGNGNQMLRVVCERDYHERAPRPWMLEATQTLHTEHNVVEVLPKVHTLFDILRDPNLVKAYGIENKDVQHYIMQLMVDAAHDGYLFCDPSLSNVGIARGADGQNIPLVIDPGAVAPLGKLAGIHNLQLRIRVERNPHYFDERAQLYAREEAGKGDLMPYINYLKEQSPTPPRVYRAAQQCHRQELGLEMEKLRNVLGREECKAALREFYEERKSYGPQPRSKHVRLGAQLIENRISADELGDIIEEAMHAPDQGQGFCERIRQEALRRGAIKERK